MSRGSKISICRCSRSWNCSVTCGRLSATPAEPSIERPLPWSRARRERSRSLRPRFRRSTRATAEQGVVYERTHAARGRKRSARCGNGAARPAGVASFGARLGARRCNRRRAGSPAGSRGGAAAGRSTAAPASADGRTHAGRRRARRACGPARRAKPALRAVVVARAFGKRSVRARAKRSPTCCGVPRTATSSERDFLIALERSAFTYHSHPPAGIGDACERAQRYRGNA